MPARIILIIMATLSIIACNASTQADTVVVCPEKFRAAFQPWLDYRQAQGHTVKVVPSTASATQLAAFIKRHASAHRLDAILLVGDCRSGRNGVGQQNDGLVATHYVPARAIDQMGGASWIVSDNPYADIDGDQIPDVAIGRLPADSPKELSRIVQKIIDYESCTDFGHWRRQINLVAGVGNFGPVVDGVIEHMTRGLLTSCIPPGFKTTMTQASLSSVYCPPPDRLAETVVNRMNEGCLFWVYMGHGQTRELDWLVTPQRRYPLFRASDLTRVHCGRGKPVALLFCCLAGDFDAKEDCLAEELICNGDGPVAAIAGSDVTTPYAMSLLGLAMMEEFFPAQRATLGDVFLRAKRIMAKPNAPDARRTLINLLGNWFGQPDTNLADERQDHLHLFNLFGDPLLRLRHPNPIQLDMAATAEPGTSIPITITSSVQGEITIELVERRDRIRSAPTNHKSRAAGKESLIGFQETYRHANDAHLSIISFASDRNENRTNLPIPSDTAGAYHVRVFIAGESGFALGARELIVRTKTEAEQ